MSLLVLPSMFHVSASRPVFLAMTLFVLATCPGSSSDALPSPLPPPGGNPILVPLKKLTVPVRKNGEVVSFKYSFAGSIAIGSPHHGPQQEFSIIFDTGSGQVVVPDQRCNSQACLAHRRYDIGKSWTPSVSPVNADGSVPSHHRDEVEIRFGTGVVKGQFVHEDVCVGVGLVAGQQICMEMNIVAAQSMSDNPFLEFEFDGIVGLGLEGLAVSKEFSFLNRLATQAGRFQFAIYLAQSDSETGHEIAIGGYNHKRLRGDLQWTPAIQPERGFWQVRIRGVRIGNTSLDICNVEGGCPGIVDTGSSHLGVPKAWTSHLISELSGSPGGSADCRHIATPDMHLDFDGFSLTLSTRDYMRKLPTAHGSSAGGAVAATKPGAANEASGDVWTACVPKVTPVFIPASFGTGNFFILGEPVFSRYYTVFEWDRRRIGFGSAKHVEEAPETAHEEPEVEDTILFVQLSIEFNVQPNILSALPSVPVADLEVLPPSALLSALADAARDAQVEDRAASLHEAATEQQQQEQQQEEQKRRRHDQVYHHPHRPHSHHFAEHAADPRTREPPGAASGLDLSLAAAPEANHLKTVEQLMHEASTSQRPEWRINRIKASLGSGVQDAMDTWMKKAQEAVPHDLISTLAGVVFSGLFAPA